MILRVLLLIAAISVAGLGMAARGAASSAASAPTAAEIRSLDLIDQDGRPFRLGDAIGRTMVLNFIFTGCGDICPTQTADLAEIQRQLPAEVRSRVIFVSISIDPEHDIPGTLRQFGDEQHVDFTVACFLTGTPAAIDRIAAFYGAPRPPGSAPLTVTQHDATIHLIDAKGQGKMRYRGAPLDTARLARDIATFSADNDFVAH